MVTRITGKSKKQEARVGTTYLLIVLLIEKCIRMRSVKWVEHILQPTDVYMSHSEINK